MVRILRAVLGLCNGMVLERVEFDEDTEIDRPRAPEAAEEAPLRGGRPALREDEGSGERRRWRGLDLGTVVGVA